MFKSTKAFSSFSVDDLQTARTFYGQTLDLEVSETPEGLALNLSDGGRVFVYPKPNHEPATFTVLNFEVDDIDAAVTKAKELGIVFESYGGEIATDEKGVFRGLDQGKGPNIAWFKDPAGNILSVIQTK
jgi:predicted enzyme related to lactoylglutathione lyase